MSNEELAVRVKDGKVESMEQLYNQTYPLIYKLCSRFAGLEDMQDLLQEGYLALYKAVQIYDPGRGAGFVTVLYMVLKQSLRRYLSECGSVVRLPEYKRTLIYQYNRIVDDYEKRLARRPTAAEIAAILEIPIEQVGDIEKAAEMASTASTDAPITEDLTVLDTVEAPENQIDDLIDRLELEQLRRDLWPAMGDVLSDREMRLLSMRYADGQTLQECGQVLDISAGRAAVIEKQSLRKLRESRTFCSKIEPYRDSLAYSLGIKYVNFKSTHTSSTEKAAFKIMGIE